MHILISCTECAMSKKFNSKNKPRFSLYHNPLSLFQSCYPLKELYTSGTAISETINWTPLSNELRGKIQFGPHPPENRERNCFPFAFWKVPFAFWKVLFAFWKVPSAFWKVLKGTLHFNINLGSSLVLTLLNNE